MNARSPWLGIFSADDRIKSDTPQVMPAPRKYPPELRERAQRLVAEAREQEPGLSLNAAVLRIGPRVGVNPDTLRGWVKQGDIATGKRAGTTTVDASRIRDLERRFESSNAPTRSSWRRRLSSRGSCAPRGAMVIEGW